MSQTKPALSVTVLNYNYARFLPRALDSILSQTFEDFEVVLIDDCSKDNSVEVIQPYLKDPRVRFLPNERNLGFQGSLIRGTEEHSHGDVLSVISADDLVLDKRAFETQMAMLADPEVALCFSAGALVNTQDGSRSPHHSMPGDAVSEPREAFQRFLFDESFWAMHSGAMFKRSAYEAAGGYRRDIALPLDFAIFMKLCLQGKTAYSDAELYGYGIHGGQMSSSRFRQNAEEVRLIIEEAALDGQRLFGLNPGTTRRRALKRAMHPILINESHSSGARNGLSAIAAWLAVAPLPTLTSRSMWIALSRIALGSGGSGSLRSLRRKLQPSRA